MKKSILYGLMTSLVVLSSAAYATEPEADDQTSALTTKGYVDAGLKYVYDVASGTSNGAVQNLQNAVGTAGQDEQPGTGLTGRVESLEDTVGDDSSGLVKDVDDVKDALSNGNGGYIDVSALKTTVDTLDSLSTDGLENNKTYVLQTNGSGEGSWSEIEIESTWNANAFETNVLNGGN